MGFCWQDYRKRQRRNLSSRVIYIRCNNDNLKEKVVETIKDIDWEDFVISSKSPTISQWMIRKYLKEHIPELE